jgi:hypothetical protein
LRERGLETISRGRLRPFLPLAMTSRVEIDAQYRRYAPGNVIVETIVPRRPVPVPAILFRTIWEVLIELTTQISFLDR